MKATVQRWGNTLAVRIPKAYADETGLSQNAQVEMTLTDGVLVIKPIAPRKHRGLHNLPLEAYLEKITAQNLHEPTYIGEPVGKELL